MPDDRFFHKCAGHSEKVTSLTDFEELMWRYYVLSSDDFGVMRFDHHAIQNDHERARSKAPKVIQRSLEHIRDVGLVFVFEHQGKAFCYSRNWMRYQKIEYPRDTILPAPPMHELAQCESSTADLFESHPGGKRGRDIRKLVGDGLDYRSARLRVLDSDAVGDDSRLTHAGALAQAKAEAQAVASAEAMAVRWLVDRHQALHAQYRGVAYLGNPLKDYQAARELVAAFPDPAMQEALIAYGLNDNDPWMNNGPRTIARIKSQASKYAEELKAKKLA